MKINLTVAHNRPNNKQIKLKKYLVVEEKSNNLEKQCLVVGWISSVLLQPMGVKGSVQP
jgi:hypothetical protein